MGLSDEERLRGVTFSVYRLNKLYKRFIELRKMRPYFGRYNDIFAKLKYIWHDLVGKNSNGIHWLFGSESVNVIKSTDNGLWATALKSNAPELDYTRDDEELKFREEEPRSEKENHNHLDHGLSIPGLLNHCHDGEILALVYKVFNELENIIYSLRRYNDEFVKKLKLLDRKVSVLQGECFTFFTDNPDFTKAYILNRICVQLFGDEYYTCTPKEKWDFITKIAHEEAHYIGGAMDRSVDELSQIHLKLTVSGNKRKKKNHKFIDNTEHRMNRLLTIIDFSATRIGEYTHIHTRILDSIKKSRKLDKKNIDIIAAALAATVDVHKKHKEKQDKMYEETEPRELGIYYRY